MVEEWEKQPGESPQAFAAFVLYRDLGPARSDDRAYCLHRGCLPGAFQAPGSWKRWFTQWRWAARAAAWDEELDRQNREARIAEVQAMGRRHAGEAREQMAALMRPARQLLARFEDPAAARALEEELKILPAAALFPILIRIAAVLPRLQEAERQARGIGDDGKSKERLVVVEEIVDVHPVP